MGNDGSACGSVLWMGVYPETFVAPMRKDIATLETRLASAKPKGDAQVVVGQA
jgi:NADH-quinone oxidoreductase subunit M